MWLWRSHRWSDLPCKSRWQGCLALWLCLSFAFCQPVCNLLLFQGQCRHKEGSVRGSPAVVGSSCWWGWRGRVPRPWADVALSHSPAGNWTLQGFSFFSVSSPSSSLSCFLPLFSSPFPQQSCLCPSYPGGEVYLGCTKRNLELTLFLLFRTGFYSFW